ncbi:MAG: RNA polymerase sigma factor FliA [Gemmatimonadaceae bacterium]|nr:RNA polymerase sigma factor FliA [Gemmatimonadaceae bacterium]
MPTTRTQSQPAKPTPIREDHLRNHLGLVYHVARQLSRVRTMELELDELVSAGTLGLIEAYNNFDESRGLAFSTFAAPRIRGAMLDEMRRQDHVPRSVRRRTRELTAATESLTNELGRVPDSASVAQRMGVDVGTFHRWQWEGDGARFVPLECSPEASAGSRAIAEHREAAIEPEIDEHLTRQQEVSRLHAAIAALPPTERQVLSLYYFEDLKLSEIAQILCVSESRVSQIRGRAVARLRCAIGSLRTAVA